MAPTNSRLGSSDPKYHELASLDRNGTDVKLEGALGDVTDGDGHGQCGLGRLKCRCLQLFAHPNWFVLQVGLMYMGVYGSSGVYMSGVISTIEKRFQLKSSESGLLMSMNDISALCGVLFVSHFAGKFHRPRILGISGLIVALGTFMTALPQFLFDNPALDAMLASDGKESEGMARFSYNEELTCRPLANETVCTAEEIQASGSQLASTWPLILGQLLCGIGSTALTPLAITYVDDAVEKRLLPVYMALMWLPMTVAPLIGYSLSSYCLSIFADFYKTDARLEITPLDPQWQGAWWMGFIFYGCYLCVFSVPFFFFPRRMRQPESYFCVGWNPDCCSMVGRKGRGGGEDAGLLAMAGLVSHDETKISLKPIVAIKEFLASLWRLLSNMTYVWASAGFIALVLCFGGFGVFAAKYIQLEFGTSPGQAGLLMGFANMPGTLIGLILGGAVTSQLAGNQRGYAVITLVVHSLSVLVLVLMMFMGCPNIDIAGLTTPYATNTSATSGFDVYTTCNANCSCARGILSPVCGSDNVTYVTACFAGCKGFDTDASNRTIFQDCSCINPTESTEETTSGFALLGACVSSCSLLVPYVVLIGFTAAFGSLSFNPSFMMLFRSVLDKDRHLALGFYVFIAKILGFIPAPVIFGAVIESQCTYWQESCQETGECMLYDRPGFRLAYLGLTTGFRFLSLVCFGVSSYFVFKSTLLQPGNEKEAEAEQPDSEGSSLNDTKCDGIWGKETRV